MAQTIFYLHERVVSIQDTLAPASPPDRATPRASAAVLHAGLGEDAVHEVVAEPSRSPTPCTPPPQRPERSPGIRPLQEGAVRGLRQGMSPPGHLTPPPLRPGCGRALHRPRPQRGATAAVPALGRIGATPVYTKNPGSGS